MKKSKLYFIVVLVFIAAMAFANFQGVSQLGIPPTPKTASGWALTLSAVPT
jgi:hypothetical protein